MRGLRGLTGLVADRMANKLYCRLEEEDQLPLEPRLWDVVVDDPDMLARHEYRSISAGSARAAGAEAYRRAVREEGFRVSASMPAGDETVVQVGASEFAIYCTVHQRGKHPDIEYRKPHVQIKVDDRATADLRDAREAAKRAETEAR